MHGNLCLVAGKKVDHMQSLVVTGDLSVDQMWAHTCTIYNSGNEKVSEEIAGASQSS